MNAQQGPGQRGPRFQQGRGGGGGLPLEAILTEEQRTKFFEELFAEREKNRPLNPDEKFMKLRLGASK